MVYRAIICLYFYIDIIHIKVYLFRLQRWCWWCVTGAPRSRTAFPGMRSCPASGSAWGWRRGAGTATWTTCLQAEPYRRPASRILHRPNSRYHLAAVKLHWAPAGRVIIQRRFIIIISTGLYVQLTSPIPVIIRSWAQYFVNIRRATGISRVACSKYISFSNRWIKRVSV